MTDQVTEQVDEKVEDTTEESKVTELSPTEKQAQAFGWKPKDKWVEEGGVEDEWVPAKHFLKFGDLKQKLILTEREISKQNKVIGKMKEHYITVRKDAYEDAIKDLRTKRMKALEDQDLVQAEIIKERMNEVENQFKQNNVLPPEIERELEAAQQKETVPTPPPEFHDFLDKNPWYVSDRSKQDKMSREADKIGKAFVEMAAEEGRSWTAKEVYEEVHNKIRKLYPEKFTTPKSPQDDTSSTPQRGSTKGSVKLTDEEMQVCKAFNITPEQYIKLNKGR